MKPVDNRVGTGSHQVTDGVSRLSTSGVLPERPRIQYGYRGTCQVRRMPCDTYEVSGKLLIFRERQQAVRAAESKCLHRTPQGVRAARKGTRGLLPRAGNWSSQARVFDGTLQPNPEDSLHYCLLLGDGDINNRGEGDEAFNTRVCRPRGVQKTSKRGPSPSRDRACAKTDIFWSVRLSGRIPPFLRGQTLRFKS